MKQDFSLDSASRALLDSLEQPVMAADSAGVPQFLSARAAELFEIRDRSELSAEAPLLEPLCELAARAKAAAARQNPLSALRQGPQSDVAEFELVTRTGRRFPALGYARPIRAGSDGWICVFQDMTAFEPFFRAIEQSRKTRALLLLVSAYLGRSLVVDSRGQGITAAYQAAEREFFQNVASRSEDWMRTDLLPALSLAVDIADPLIPSSAKILIDARTSALLKVSQPNFLRIVSHLLLEAADFVGPFGSATLKASVSAKQAELSLFAQRRQEIPLGAAPLELYLYRRYMPHHYKISISEPAEGEESFPELRFGAAGSIAPELVSDNLAIASELASACGIVLALKRPQAPLLVIGAGFPLLD